MQKGRWSPAAAHDWNMRFGWRAGMNFLPSNAINQIEMWSEDTFCPSTIARELNWASAMGFKTARVFLHDAVWRHDAVGFKTRIRQFLDIAHRADFAVLFVFFDDCWHEPQFGPQPSPAPGVHNSAWARSPGRSTLLNNSRWPELEAYVRDIARTFGDDPRIMGWDVYNEVTNTVMHLSNLPPMQRAAALSASAQQKRREDQAAIELMTLAFGWLRSEKVQQPLTAGEYDHDDVLNARLAALSDIISFHHYRDRECLERLIGRLRNHGRPIWCTEYLNRHVGCTFQTHLPVFHREQVSCWNWGLVDGKSQTKFAWSDAPGAEEPAIWFHDILRSEGVPYDHGEVAFLKTILQPPLEEYRAAS